MKSFRDASSVFVIICYLSIADEGVGLPPFRADLVLRSNLLSGSLFIYCLFSPNKAKSPMINGAWLNEQAICVLFR